MRDMINDFLPLIGLAIFWGVAGFVLRFISRRFFYSLSPEQQQEIILSAARDGVIHWSVKRG